MDTLRDPDLPRLAGRRGQLHPGPQVPRLARRQRATGNLLGAAGMALVVALDLLHRPTACSTTGGSCSSAAPIGSVVGWLGARRVPMTAMPQMVAIFNGAGGGAAALVAIAEFLRDAGDTGELLPLPFMIATLLGAVIGAVRLTGSVMAFGKLQGSSPPGRSAPRLADRHRRPVRWPSSRSASTWRASSQQRAALPRCSCAPGLVLGVSW